ncbi:MAG: DEAD/DEAH box helicase family protein [Treponema sp.]|nr:DEAD/DEAH box helicase family protein [Treponema sp.]
MAADKKRATANVLEIELPEIADRSPFLAPKSHLIKTGPAAWAETPGRRASKAIMVDGIRKAVDSWREGGYRGASDTSQRLLQYWFDEGHVDEGNFRFFFCQREAIETIVYLYEVRRFRDAFKLITEYYEEPSGAQLELGVTTRGQRKIRRYIPEIAKEAEQDLPREDLPRMAVKMATGSGKTLVMALAIVWSYLHQRFEGGSELADNFLVVAPNVIVFERLKVDFEGGRIFLQLPLIPPEWRGEWQVDVILRGESKMPGASGTIFLTNIQQIYERETDAEVPINPVAALLGKKPPAKLNAPLSLLDRVRSLPNLMVINDEAHHLWDDTLRWNETLLELDDHFRRRGAGGLVAWLDFSATPKNQNGTFFPWIVVDYPLAQAVEDRIVKTPLIIHQTDKRDPDVYAHDEAGDAYNEWIAIAVARWREHVKDYGAVGEKPILFVMAETTQDADSIAERLGRETDLKDRVLVIHTDRLGEVSKKEEDRIRRAAREIDQGRSDYRAVVSVLMLREGWDVRNVSVILGLRPFSAKANILPEQAIGRGLRLMRGIPMGNSQVLELIGTNAFEDFVRELEKEGLGVGLTRKNPRPGTPVYPAGDRLSLDIEIPRTTALFEREFRNIERLDPLAFGPIASEEDLDGELRQRIELIHGTVDISVHSDEVEFNEENVPSSENLLASLTNRVMRRARVTGLFARLYPQVRAYVRERCFGGRVELDEVAVRRALNDNALMDGIAALFSRRIGELTAERRDVKLSGEPWRLSEMEEFSWRREFTEADKTIFNVVACYNAFEADFARFLDKAPDVLRFAKLCEHFTGFHVQYLKSSGALGTYYPDFVVVREKRGREERWIVETKGQEDVEVAAKDEQMKRWCAETTMETGLSWNYVKVPYGLFHGKHFSSYEELIRTLGGEAGQLVLFGELGADASAAAGHSAASSPPVNLSDLFWKTFGDRVPSGALVMASKSVLSPKTVKNALDRLIAPDASSEEAFLFFIDLEPEANWAHACAYAFVSAERTGDWYEAEWPPQTSIDLVVQGRP